MSIEKMTDEQRIEVEEAFRKVVSEMDLQSQSSTPDFVVSKYLVGCLEAWNTGVQFREMWYEEVRKNEARFSP